MPQTASDPFSPPQPMLAPGNRQPPPALDDEQFERLRLFPPRVQSPILKLASSSRPMADLLQSCPAILFALATRRGTPKQRKIAIEMVNEGAPLAFILAALNLPVWMRKLTPHYFSRTLPADLPGMDRNSRFHRQILSLAPQKDAKKALFLTWVLEGYRACDERFALWVARHISAQRRRPALRIIAPLAAFAWYSQHKELDGAKLLTRRWTPKMSFSLAVSLSYVWLIRILLDITINHKDRNGVWAETSQVGPYEIVPLLESQPLIDESKAMTNCLHTYPARVLHDLCYVYSLRLDGRPVANLEVYRENNQSPTWQIAQLLGPHNTRVNTSTLIAANKWLADTARRHDESGHRPQRPYGIDPNVWMLIWEPYWRQNGRKGPLGASPREKELRQVLKSLSNLAVDSKT